MAKSEWQQWDLTWDKLIEPAKDLSHAVSIFYLLPDISMEFQVEIGTLSDDIYPEIKGWSIPEFISSALFLITKARAQKPWKEALQVLTPTRASFTSLAVEIIEEFTRS